MLTKTTTLQIKLFLYFWFVRSECRTPPLLRRHWTKLRFHPITAAVCQVHRCPQSALQTPHVRTHLCGCRNMSSIYPGIYEWCFHTFLSADQLHDGLSSNHSVLGHSPGLVQGPRETDGTSAEYNKENKRSHADRGNNTDPAAELMLKAFFFLNDLFLTILHLLTDCVNLVPKVNFLLVFFWGFLLTANHLVIIMSNDYFSEKSIVSFANAVSIEQQAFSFQPIHPSLSPFVLCEPNHLWLVYTFLWKRYLWWKMFLV